LNDIGRNFLLGNRKKIMFNEDFEDFYLPFYLPLRGSPLKNFKIFFTWPIIEYEERTTRVFNNVKGQYFSQLRWNIISGTKVIKHIFWAYFT
jgi:hypothetical protein